MAKQFFDVFTEVFPDQLLDVNGGNPYSPIWICGLEFGGGRNNWSDYENAMKKGKRDLTESSYVIYPDVNEYEYRTLSNALVAARCLLGGFERSLKKQ